MINKFYWFLHATVTWAAGLGLIVVAGFLTALYGELHWIHMTVGILVIATGEIARASRSKPPHGTLGL